MDNLMIMATDLMARETRRVDVAAQNIANGGTPGYKQAVAFDQVVNDLRRNEGVPVSATNVVTDFTPGKLQHTGNPTDLAIRGQGFFEVATPEGAAYTRAGAFHRDEQGYLVNAQGFRLQSQDGGDVRVSQSDWRVEQDGTIIDHGIATIKVRVMTFDNDQLLARSGNGLFKTSETPLEASHAQLAQGFLEASNTVTGNDMVQIMQAMRRVESGQKLVYAYDDMIGNVLQRLGDM
ncbi:flagellar hook basal-body protein [Dyella sp.]|uniref:flagellar hook-basal body protein n=1 Tax=Dyella sp. TaxID=1869338 RepID=UPI002FDAA19C